MRETIRRRAIEAVPVVQVASAPGVIDYVLSRVFEPHAATAETELPFIIVREMPRTIGDNFEASARVFEIVCFAERTSFRALDQIVDQIEAAFDYEVFEHAGTPLLSEQTPSGADALESEWGSIFKSVTLQVFDLSLLDMETFAPDVIDALKTWAATTFVGQIQTDVTTWLPSDALPGVHFKLDGIPQIVSMTNAASWLSARVRVHVLAPSQSTRLVWTKRIAEALATQREVLFADAPGAFYIDALAADSSAHPVSQGQIAITGRYALDVSAPAAAAIVHGYVSGEGVIEETEVL